jgi:hypothetical protein
VFLEKFSRYFRRYELQFKPRHKRAAYMPLVAAPGQFSVLDALQIRVKSGKAANQQPNGDVVELMKVEHRPAQGALVLLFHRGSPGAADPTYRRKGRKGVTVRTATKKEDEEQSVSAHLIVSTVTLGDGRFRAVLEEIPKLSMALVQSIIGQALSEYPYDYQTEKKKTEQTYCVIKAEGIKSETITGALKTGKVNFIKLVRPGPADYVDSEGLWEPMDDVMKLRVTGKINPKTWQDKIGALVGKAKADGWEKFNLEIDLDGNRSRTVTLDREQDAKEILFVRAEEVAVKDELPVCSADFQDGLVAAGVKLLKADAKSPSR